jgi:hypothetical protein
MLKTLALASLLVGAMLSVSACTTFGDARSPAGSPATADASDPGRENSTPTIADLQGNRMRDTAFPAGSRDISPE